MKRRTALLAAATGAGALLAIGQCSEDVLIAEANLVAAVPATFAAHRMRGEFLGQPRTYYADKVAEACKESRQGDHKKLCEVAKTLEVNGHKKAAIRLYALGAHSGAGSANPLFDMWARLKEGNSEQEALDDRKLSTGAFEANLADFNEVIDWGDPEAERVRTWAVSVDEERKTKRRAPQGAEKELRQEQQLSRDLDRSTRTLVADCGLDLASVARELGANACEGTESCRKEAEAAMEVGFYVEAARQFALAQDASTNPDEQDELASLGRAAWFADGTKLWEEQTGEEQRDSARKSFSIGEWEVDENELDRKNWLEFDDENPRAVTKGALAQLYAEGGDCKKAQAYFAEYSNGLAWEAKTGMPLFMVAVDGWAHYDIPGILWRRYKGEKKTAKTDYFWTDLDMTDLDVTVSHKALNEVEVSTWDYATMAECFAEGAQQ